MCSTGDSGDRGDRGDMGDSGDCGDNGDEHSLNFALLSSVGFLHYVPVFHFDGYSSSITSTSIDYYLNNASSNY